MHPLICTRCGSLVELPPDPRGPLRCPVCRHEQGSAAPARPPLLCLTGPSGTGKSTLSRLLLDRLADRVVVLEQDLLWIPELSDPAGEHRTFRSLWLRLAAMIGANGRPVLLCGTVVPPEFEPLPERALFSEVHYLALTCDPEILAGRLRSRPPWREWDEHRIAEMLDYAAWLTGAAATLDPPVTLLDTTHAAPAETADAVCAWVDRYLPG